MEMKKIDIKGREYVEVNQRVLYFIENFNGWSINTEWIQVDANVAICKCNIVDENGTIRSTGTAMELHGNSFINKTSHVENCETSAVGRALGFLGVGIDTSIASFDEVANAIKTQNRPDKNKPQRKKATSKKFVPEKSVDIARTRINKGFDYLGFNKQKQQDWVDEYLPVGLYDATIDDLNKLLEALEKEAKGVK